MSTVPIPRFHDVPCPVPAPVPAVLPIEAAYHRVRSEIEAVPDDDLVAMNVDPPAVVGVAKAAAVRLVGLRPALADALRHFDGAAFDKLSDYADALLFLHSEYKRSEEPKDALPAIYEEALLCRQNVIQVGRALVSLRLLDTTTFEQAGTVIGYRNVGVELLGLCTTLLEKLPQVGPRCPITPEQLQRGRALGHLLLEAVSERAIANEQKSSVQKQRQRAFTLLSKHYDEVRRAVIYVRWHDGDADALAPSFFAGRNAGARTPKGETPEAARGQAPSTEAKPEAAKPAAEPRLDASRLPDDKPAGDPLFVPVSDEPFLRS